MRTNPGALLILVGWAVAGCGGEAADATRLPAGTECLAVVGGEAYKGPQVVGIGRPEKGDRPDSLLPGTRVLVLRDEDPEAGAMRRVDVRVRDGEHGDTVGWMFRRDLRPTPAPAR